MYNSCLNWLFQKFNKLYFKKKFPKSFVVRFSKLDKVIMGVCGNKIVYLKAANGYRKERVIGPILINKKLRNARSIVAMTLLHEMVHAANPELKGHGPKFNKQMLKLAKAGAFNAWW